MKNLFKTKPIAELLKESPDKPSLKRTLGPFNLVTLGIGAIIGTGIFVITGTAAANFAGPAIVISFIISGLACIFAGLCYAEFASMIPVAGSAYTYAYATMGELIAWIIGWDLILEYLFAASTVAVGWSGYVVSFLKDRGIVIPHHLCHAPFDHSPESGWYSTGSFLNFPAVFVVAIISVLLILGIRESAKFNNIIVVVKVSVILLFIGFGLSYINSDNLTPFIPPNEGVFGHYGWSGILRGAGVIFFAYIGFDAVSTAAQEAKNPQRDMPIGILVSLGIATILYILVALVMTGIISYKELNVDAPMATAIDAVGPGLNWLTPYIKLGAIAGLSSVILVMMLGQSRIFYTMSKDGLMPDAFSALHPKFQTPHISTMVTGVASIIMAGLFPVSILGELVSIGTLLAFFIVCVGVMVLRYKRPDIQRPFKTPLMPLIPILGAGTALLQMVFLPGDTWLRLIIWMALGLTVYFLYGRKNSRINKA